MVERQGAGEAGEAGGRGAGEAGEAGEAGGRGQGEKKQCPIPNSQFPIPYAQ